MHCKEHRQGKLGTLTQHSLPLAKWTASSFTKNHNRPCHCSATGHSDFRQHSQLCGASVCPSSILSPCAQLVKLQFCLPTYEGLVQLATYLQQKFGHAWHPKHSQLILDNAYMYKGTHTSRGSTETRSVVHGPSCFHTILNKSCCTRGKGKCMLIKYHFLVCCCRMLSQ